MRTRRYGIKSHMHDATRTPQLPALGLHFWDSLLVLASLPLALRSTSKPQGSRSHLWASSGINRRGLPSGSSAIPTCLVPQSSTGRTQHKAIDGLETPLYFASINCSFSSEVHRCLPSRPTLVINQPRPVGCRQDSLWAALCLVK